MIKAMLDWSAFIAAAGTLTKVLPALATLWTIAWLSLRMWESKTAQEWRGRRKARQSAAIDSGTPGPHLQDDN